MGFRVIFAPQAIERLSEIVRFVARDNPDTAMRFGNRLIDQAQMLSSFPELGSPYPKRPGVRRLRYRSYFIYYRIDHGRQTIEVLDYWHSARREPELS